MKEILIITEKSLIESTKHIAKEYDKEDVAEHRIEQVPETWEELKELCEDIKEITITEEGHINVDFVYFTKDGKIYTYVEGILTSSIFLPVSKDRTPQQMWNIIKSLIGE